MLLLARVVETNKVLFLIGIFCRQTPQEGLPASLAAFFLYNDDAKMTFSAVLSNEKRRKRNILEQSG